MTRDAPRLLPNERVPRRNLALRLTDRGHRRNGPPHPLLCFPAPALAIAAGARPKKLGATRGSRIPACGVVPSLAGRPALEKVCNTPPARVPRSKPRVSLRGPLP
jgi:hypothetical protein